MRAFYWHEDSSFPRRKEKNWVFVKWLENEKVLVAHYFDTASAEKQSFLKQLVYKHIPLCSAVFCKASWNFIIDNWMRTGVTQLLWIEQWLLFFEKWSRAKHKTLKSVVFGSVNTILQAKQGYLCCGWNNRNSQRTMSFKVVEQELRQLVTALHLKISLEQMYTMPSLVVLFEQECKQSC